MALAGECRALLRVLLAAAAVSYLICVLIMSGMQKEDLDVSMLVKLQRYNVNIDDMNNEQNRQECLTRNKDFTRGKIDKNNDNYVPTTEKATTNIEDPLKGLSIAAVLNYFKSKQSTILEETTTSLDTQQEMDTRATKYFENQSKSNMNILQRYVQLNNLNRSIYKTQQNYETTSNYNVNENINTKIDEIVPNGVKNNEFINTIFKDYFLQTKILPTTTENTITRATINIQNVYKQIEELMSVSNTNTKENTNEKLQHNIVQNKKYIVSNTGPIMSQATPDKENQIKTIYDFLTTVNQFKSLPLPQNNTTVYSIKTKKYVEKNDMTASPKQLNYEEIRSNVPEVDTDIRKTNALSSDLVKEIAKTVKDVIIKDLRNELSHIYSDPVTTTTSITSTTTTITPTTTTTPITTTPPTTTKMPTTTTITTSTTETPPTTSSRIMTREKELAIMDTFMELYEQIKALKHTTFVLDAHNKTETAGNGFIQELKIKDQIQPIVNYNELQKPDTKVKISSVRNYNTKPYSNLNSYRPRQTKNRHVPITIQTNSIEIQPLAVSVSKPESLINQNIVVNSRQSVQQRYEYPTHSIPRENTYSDIRIMHRNRTHKYNKHSPVKQHEGYNMPHNPIRLGHRDIRHDDVIRFRMKKNGHSGIDTDYYEKINFGDNGHNIHFGNRNIPRFHERLERLDERIAALSNKDIPDKREHHNDDVPERQQLSLVDMKKGTSYDDTHFKNFLKTQQKVTDILERILATRSKTNEARSVEST